MPEDELPQEVVAELKRRTRSGIVVGERSDRAILADADAVLSSVKLKRVRQSRGQWTWGLLTVGSLAAVLLIAVIPQWNAGETDRTESMDVAADKSVLQRTSDFAAESAAARFRKEDIDRDGRVDILDAFALARLIHGTGRLTTGDQNGDGVVDEHDVDLIALSAVML